jgi:hypothetical protein
MQRLLLLLLSMEARYQSAFKFIAYSGCSCECWLCGFFRNFGLV